MMGRETTYTLHRGIKTKAPEGFYSHRGLEHLCKKRINPIRYGAIT
jgi:hypothetical protein